MARFLPRPGAERQLARGPEVRRFLQNVADAGAARARSLAPVRSGAYQRGIDGEVAVTDDGLVARIKAEHFTSAAIELHGVNDGRGPLAPLRRAVGSLNLRVTGKPSPGE